MFAGVASVAPGRLAYEACTPKTMRTCSCGGIPASLSVQAAWPTVLWAAWLRKAGSFSWLFFSWLFFSWLFCKWIPPDHSCCCCRMESVVSGYRLFWAAASYRLFWAGGDRLFWASGDRLFWTGGYSGQQACRSDGGGYWSCYCLSAPLPSTQVLPWLQA